MKLIELIQKNILYIAWITALVASVGSIALTEVFQFLPCSLCWYQRILMYPLIIVIAVGIILKDKKLYAYVLPFTILGMIVALYQHLLQIGAFKELVVPCSTNIPCTTKYIDWLGGLVTIPLLSFLSFLIIAICMLLYRNSISLKND